MKICSVCKEEKPKEDFHLSKSTKDGRFFCCKKCSLEKNRQWRKKNPDRNRELGRQNAHDALTRIKNDVFEAYGNKCVCCGEKEIHFLTLDHIYGVPDRHKSGSGKRITGLAFWRIIKKENFPKDCRILCWNCNASYGFYGFCPHQPHDENQRRY